MSYRTYRAHQRLLKGCISEAAPLRTVFKSSTAVIRRTVDHHSYGFYIDSSRIHGWEGGYERAPCRQSHR